LIGLRVRVCGGAAGTVNVGSRAPASLSFIWRCVRGSTATKRQTPPIRARLRSGNRSRDPSGEITSLTSSICQQQQVVEKKRVGPAAAAYAYLKEIPLLRSVTMHACLHTDRCPAFGTLSSALFVFSHLMGGYLYILPIFVLKNGGGVQMCQS
jgi:hypothetical protein